MCRNVIIRINKRYYFIYDIISYLPVADEFMYWFPPNLVKQSSRTRTMGPHFFSEIRRFILSSIFSFRGSAFRSIFPCPPNPTSPKTAMYPREELLVYSGGR